MSLEHVYDELGGDYLSDQHRTVMFLHMLQDSFLTESIILARNNTSINLSDLTVLNIGAGPDGNARQMTGVLDKSRPIGDACLESCNVVYFDISQKMLAHFEYGIIETLATCGGIYSPFKFVKGDASCLDQYFSSNSFNIVLAALCDHIPNPDKFFSDVHRILTPGGAFITTYPAKEISHTIRTQLYGISPQKTRFSINGQNYIVPSKALTPEELLNIYSTAGFIHSQTNNLYYHANLICFQPYLQKHNFHPSSTILKAVHVIDRSIDDIPIIVGGIGFKK